MGHPCQCLRGVGYGISRFEEPNRHTIGRMQFGVGVFWERMASTVDSLSLLDPGQVGGNIRTQARNVST